MLWTKGRPKPFRDVHGNVYPGSISEKIRVVVNGVRQGMFIRGRSVENPVLLYLHGGMPDYFLTETHPTGLDGFFTMVWWEQRGSGLSYSKDIPPQTMTPEQLVADTLELTNQLRRRFNQDRIYLMGHSGGTFFGIQAAARAPEMYRAYIGVAQISRQLRSEQLAYDYMLRRLKEEGKTRMAQRMEAAPVTEAIPLPRSYMRVRDQAMHSLGVGTMHDMRSVVRGIVLAALRSREYTLREKLNLWRGKLFSGKFLWNAQLAADLTKLVPRLDLPVYFIHGIHDCTVSYTEARSYYEQLDAPLKGFYTFRRSAHSPLFEEPDRMCEIMRADVLGGTTRLADKRYSDAAPV